jgi:hypothetical protein
MDTRDNVKDKIQEFLQFSGQRLVMAKSVATNVTRLFFRRKRAYPFKTGLMPDAHHIALERSFRTKFLSPALIIPKTHPGCIE